MTQDRWFGWDANVPPAAGVGIARDLEIRQGHRRPPADEDEVLAALKWMVANWQDLPAGLNRAEDAIAKARRNKMTELPAQRSAFYEAERKAFDKWWGECFGKPEGEDVGSYSAIAWASWIERARLAQ